MRIGLQRRTLLCFSLGHEQPEAEMKSKSKPMNDMELAGLSGMFSELPPGWDASGMANFVSCTMMKT